MTLINCKNLNLGYEGKAIITALSFTLNVGDYLFIVGENGSGKTTLMKALLGLVAPIGGSIEYGDALKKTEIGYLPQQTAVQRDFPASVQEIVLSGCLGGKGLNPFFGKKEKLLAKEMMEKVGIWHLKKRCYRELSGGQQQRVLLARALCASKKVLLLDEPVSGLDSNATAELYNLIERLNKQEKRTVIMISHDIDAAKKYASHILHIGKRAFYSSREDYLKAVSNGTLGEIEVDN